MKDPVTEERHEIAALLARHATTFEGKPGEPQSHERQAVARVLRHMIAAIGDRPKPDPTLRAFTEQERGGLRVLLDQLFEASPVAASALAQQLGLALKVDLPPPPLSVRSGRPVRVELPTGMIALLHVTDLRIHMGLDAIPSTVDYAGEGRHFGAGLRVSIDLMGG